jgi:hypothetical protein
MEFNKELITALAHGDAQAHEQIKSLPLTVQMGLGIEVDKMRREQNIIPMSNGFSIYEQPKSSYYDDEQLGQALAERNKRIREAEERQIKIQEEMLEKEVKARAERARARLAMNRR